MRDDNLHPTHGYPLRPAPNGMGFTRSAVIMGGGGGCFKNPCGFGAG